MLAEVGVAVCCVAAAAAAEAAGAAPEGSGDCGTPCGRAEEAPDWWAGVVAVR